MDLYWFSAGVCCGVMLTVVGKVLHGACAKANAKAILVQPLDIDCPVALPVHPIR